MQSVLGIPLLINACLSIIVLLLSLWRGWFLYAALVFLAAMNATLHTSPKIPVQARAAVFSGTVISEQPQETYVQLLFRIDHVRIGKRNIQLSETVLFYAETGKTYLGRNLLIRGRIKDAPYRRRPHILSGKIVAMATATSITGAVQTSVNQFIDGVLGAVLSPMHADIAMSLLLGGSGRVGRDVRDAFSRAGVLHILAVSGLHVGFVAAFAGFLLLFVPLSPQIKFVLTIFVLLLYATVTGFRPSVCRATVMAFLFGSAVLIQRNVTPLHILNVTALAFLVINPLALFDLSTQLSFAAVYGIVVLFPRCNERIGRYVHNRFVRRLLTIMAVSLSAQTFVSPLLVYYFHQLPTCAVISNCLIVPLAWVTVLLLFFCLGVGTLTIVGAHLVAYLVSIALNTIIAVSSFFANFPFSTITLHISPLFFIPFYSLFFALTRKAAIFAIVGILILGSLARLPHYAVIIKNADTSIIVSNNESTVVVTHEERNSRLQAFLARHHIRTITCLVAPQRCRVSAQRFCPLPDVLHVKKIGVGPLNFEIGSRMLLRYGIVQIPLFNEDMNNANEHEVVYIVTDGTRAYQCNSPQFGSVVDQMLVDVRLYLLKVMLLF